MVTDEFTEEIIDVVAPVVAGLTDEVLASVVEAVPPFREWVEGGNGVRHGAEQAMRGFLEVVVQGRTERLPGRQLYFDFGRIELRAGRSLDAVLTAYRVGSATTWRRIAEAGHAAGVDPRTLYALAEVVFTHAGRIASATVAGYMYEQSLATAERVDARRHLVGVLVAAPAPSPAELQAAAGEAGWRVPDALAVIAFDDERVGRVASRLPSEALTARLRGEGWALVPDPDAPGRRALLRRALADVRCAVGPAVPTPDAAVSARLARRALALIDGEDVPATGPVLADERRVDLLLAGDPELADELAAEALRPLDALPVHGRDRLLETLAVWLRHQGEVRPTAQQLHVHTQTVRYRIGRLRELIGDRMACPEGRLELELALRARRLGHRPGGDDPDPGDQPMTPRTNGA